MRIHLATHDSHTLSRRYGDADATVLVEGSVVVQRVHRGRILARRLDLVRRHEVLPHDALNNIVELVIRQVSAIRGGHYDGRARFGIKVLLI